MKSPNYRKKDRMKLLISPRTLIFLFVLLTVPFYFVRSNIVEFIPITGGVSNQSLQISQVSTFSTSTPVSPTKDSAKISQVSTNARQIYIPMVIGQVQQPSCSCYYIDSVNGLDSNSGRSPTQPWKSITKVNNLRLSASQYVYLKKGSIWSGTLSINGSGTSGSPITISTYGDGDAPVISDSGLNVNQNIGVYIKGNYVVVEGLHLTDAMVGVKVEINSNHNIIRNNELEKVGIGVMLLGQYNLVTNNHIHDLHMVVNTQGGDDDYGALGVDILDSNNEISFNRFVNCEAPSYDYGTDGGAVEIYQFGDNSYIHHNSSLNSEGFMEASSNGSGSAVNVLISYNLIINSTGLNAIHISDSTGIHIDNFRVQNNTFVDLRTHNPMSGGILWFGGTPAKNAYIFQNNIIYLKDYWWVGGDIGKITHDHNLFYFTNSSTKLGFTLSTGEVVANPLFLDIGNFDFHLQQSSPAIDNGAYLGLLLDLDQKPVPLGNSPDKGAYEFQSK
jgi:hypothetical protein